MGRWPSPPGQPPGGTRLDSFTAGGKPKRTIESLRVERRYRNVITLFLSGQLPTFDHRRHAQVEGALPRVWDVADAIVAANRGIDD